MKRFFWLKWKDSKNVEHIVGILHKNENGKYYFMYNPEFADEKMIPEGFNGIPSFGRVRGLTDEQKAKTFRIRSSDTLFSFFSMRIVQKNESDIWHGIYNMKDYDECELLTLTGATNPVDTFSVTEMDEQAINDLSNNEDVDFGMDR